MTVTEVNSATFMSDSQILIRDLLLSNITDPLTASRPSDERFVLTAYPDRTVTYPIITVRLTSVTDPRQMGQASELFLVTLPMEIRVWARDQATKDELSQSIINFMRDDILGTSGTISKNLHDWRITSALNADEPGEGKIRSRIINVEYDFVLGQT